MRKLTCLLLISAPVLFSCQGNTPGSKQKEKPAIAPSTLTHEQADTAYVHTGFYFLTETGDGTRMKLDGSGEIYRLSKMPFASVNNISSTRLDVTNTNGHVSKLLCMIFDEKGTRDLEEGTGNPSYPQLAVVIDNKLLYVVDNTNKIRTGVMCVGISDFSEEEINAMRQAVEQKK